MNSAREVLTAWAKSEGFAAIHNGAATDEQIVEDLLRWLEKHDMHIFTGRFLTRGGYLGEDDQKG